MNTIDSIGDIIRFHRNKAGLTQKQLATLSGVGKTVVFDIEQGKNSVRMNSLLAVASVLNITLEPQSPLMDEWAGKSVKGI